MEEYPAYFLLIIVCLCQHLSLVWFTENEYPNQCFKGHRGPVTLIRKKTIYKLFDKTKLITEQFHILKVEKSLPG